MEMSAQSSSSSGDGRAEGQHAGVEIVFPSEAAAAEYVDDGISAPTVCPSAPSAGSGNGAGSEDFASIVAKALDELPPELAALAKEPKNHASPRTMRGLKVKPFQRH